MRRCHHTDTLVKRRPRPATVSFRLAALVAAAGLALTSAVRAQTAGEQPKPASPEAPKPAEGAPVTPAPAPAPTPAPAPAPAEAPGHEGHNHPPVVQPTPVQIDPAQPQPMDGTPVPNPTVTPDPNGPLATPVEAKHEFGEFWAGDSLSHTFMLKNTGKAPLQILTVKPSCGCTLAGTYDKEIAPGAEGKIPVSVATKNFNGKFSKTVTVTTNDPSNATLRLEISGTAKQHVAIEPASAAFSQIKAEDVLDKTLKITNNSEQALQLTLAETKSGAFTAELKEIEAGKKFELVVKGNPPYQAQLNRGTFSMTTNITAQPKIDVQCSAYLPPRIEVKPANITLNTAQEKESTRTLRFTNNGTAEVKVTEVTSDDPQITTTITEKTPGKAYDIQVKLPQGYLPPEKGATLTLKTTDTEMATLSVPVNRPPTPKAQPKPGEALLGKTSPKISFDTTDGKKINLGEPSDNIYVLEFYTSWCGFCKRSMPEVEKVWQKYKDKGVRFIGVSQDVAEGPKAKKPEEVMKLFKDANYTFEQALDPEHKVGNPFFANSYPMMYIVGKTGNVEQGHFGAKKDLVDVLSKDLDLLLAGKPIPRAIPAAPAVSVVPAPSPATGALTPVTAGLPIKSDVVKAPAEGQGSGTDAAKEAAATSPK